MPPLCRARPMKSRRAIALLLVAVALPVAAPVTAQGAGKPTTVALAADVIDTTTYSGRIEALTRADVSTVIDAIVTEIHFQAGQTVRAGDRLFSLDRTDFELKVKTAEANVKRTGALLETARQDMERAERLKERGSISDVQYLRAKGAEALAEAVNEQTLAELRVAQTNLARTVIRAPISGVIGPPQVNIGTYAQSGSKKWLARIVQLDPVLLTYQIPYVERLRGRGIEDAAFPESLLKMIDLQVVVGEDRVHPEPAVAMHVSPGVDPDTGMLTVWAEVANPDKSLRPGMKVTVVSRPRTEALQWLSRNR